MTSHWNETISAKQYDTYAKRYPIFYNTARDLAKMTQLRQGMHIAELGSGTGASTAAFTERVGDSGHVYMLEHSHEMFLLGKRNNRAQNVTHIHRPAEELSRAIKRKIDGIVANGSLWYMDVGLVLAQIARSLKKGALFGFNVPAYITVKERITDPDSDQYFRLIMRDIMKKKFNVVFDSRMKRKNKFDMRKLHQQLAKNNMKLESTAVLEYEKTGKEIVDFNAIPTVNRLVLGDILTDSERRAVFEEAITQFDIKKVYYAQWQYYIIRKL